MSGKRDTTPLFEVLQHGRHAETRVPELGREEPGIGGEGGSGGRRGAGLGEVPIRIVGGMVQMPLAYAGVAVAVALAAILGAWVLAYQRGESEALSKQRLLESALGPGTHQEARVVELGTSEVPNARGRGEGDGDGPGALQSEKTLQQQAKPQTPVPSIGAAPFLVRSGPTEVDPRLAMHNYLQLGSQIRPHEVESAIAFLHSRGLECFGVIDRKTLGRNDGPLYVLFAGLGFPSGEADSPEAQRYREQVLAAGVAWKQAGGVRNFDDAGWVLYKP